jgi:predicted dehydrogenase
LKWLNKIHFVKVRDIIGPNHFFINQSSRVLRFNDIPEDLREDRNQRSKRALQEAIGEVSPELQSVYHLLCGLSSHDLSAMRELIGFPQRVFSAKQWNGGKFLTVVFDYGHFVTVFETGGDQQGRFDAHIEVIGENKTIQVKYDTPYIRHLPTTLNLLETVDECFKQTIIRPSYKDPYTLELEAFYEVVTKNTKPKTTPEDYKDDLAIFRMIIDALR